MITRGILWPLTAIVTWPASTFADVQRTYDVALPPSDVNALIRGGVATDPLFRRFGEGFAQSARLEVVGRVSDEWFEIYMAGKYASGIGIIGAVEPTPGGSRVTARVGWTAPTKWVMPGLTLAAFFAVAALAPEVPAAVSGTQSDGWVTLAIIALVGGGQLASLVQIASRARNRDLPLLFERLHTVLATIPGRFQTAGSATINPT